MSETEYEKKRGDDLTEREDFLKEYDISDLIGIIRSYEASKVTKKLLTEHILDNGYDLEWRAK